MDIIYNAGPLVAVLFFVSILTIAFALERFWALSIARGKIAPNKIIPTIKDRVLKNDFAGALDAAESQMGSVGRILVKGLKDYEHVKGRVSGRALRKELDLSFHEATVMEGALLERNLIPIATVGSIANLIGLVGTVLGMIQSFAAISAKGSAEKIAATQLAQGIATALVNAAGGLIVAILAVIVYNFFLSRIDRVNFDIEEASNELLEICMLAERQKS
jgi:biopolymer transport protein ExbB